MISQQERYISTENEQKDTLQQERQISTENEQQLAKLQPEQVISTEN